MAGCPPFRTGNNPMRPLLLAMAGASALLLAPLAGAQPDSVADGVLRLRTDVSPTWKLEGYPGPPRLFLCVDIDIQTGLFLSESTCRQWASARDYLERRYLGQGVVLTNWTVTCEATHLGCTNTLSLYYRIDPAPSP